MAMKILDQITRVKKRQPDPNVVLASVKNPATELRLLLIVHWADSNHQQLKQVHSLDLGKLVGIDGVYYLE